jgi:23S rRNA pseudouridine2605 synthase
MLLPRGLKRGLWMELGAADIRALAEASGTPARVLQGARESAAASPARPPRRDRPDRARGSGPRPSMAGGAPREPLPPAAPRRPRASAEARPAPSRIGADSYTRQRDQKRKSAAAGRGAKRPAAPRARRGK